MYKLYSIITYLYNFIFSAFENFFFKKNSKKSQVDRLGYEIIKFFNTKKIFLFEFKKFKKLKVNSYMNKIICDFNSIQNFLEYLFNELKLKKIITEKTGFNYKIDFFLAYTTLPIKQKDLHKGWYANHWHKDMPFTKNTLKVIIPVSELKKKSDGGIQILTIDQSNQFDNLQNSNPKFFSMRAKKNELLIFYPKKCLHRAGQISKKKRDQVMLQLNVSRNWSINAEIYNKQFFLEPKFPFFSYFLDKKIYL